MPLNNMLNSGSGFAWFDLLVCPDCAHSLVRSDVIECSHCGRQFRQIDRALCLLPSGNADAVAFDVPAPKWKARFIARFYSRAKESRNALQGLRRVLSDLRSHCWGLNAGSSSTRIHSQMINLDLCASPDVDIVGTIEDIPFGDASLHCAVSQEVLEHVADPHAAVREIYRVLVPGARFFMQTPFILGVHGAPHDYWRFTNYGLQQLLTGAGFQMEEVGVAAGAGAAIHQIAVEFAAASVAALWQRLYLPVKATAALAMSPLRLADYFTSQISPCNRIPSGFYAIARKP